MFEEKMNDARDFLSDLSEEELSNFQFTAPWQSSEIGYAASMVDSDGFSLLGSLTRKQEGIVNRKQLQHECWRLFLMNPQVNTAIRALAGRLTGLGFRTSSAIPAIQEIIENTEEDFRNRLYNFWPRYVVRALVEGELFLCFSVTNEGFVEIDFIDPAMLADNGDDSSGIIFHPKKDLLPVFYNIRHDDPKKPDEQIPSIYVAFHPDLVSDCQSHIDFDVKKQVNSLASTAGHINPRFSNLGGYCRFICAWNQGYMTRRTTGHLQSIIPWTNHYENLKKYEIDHKKSSSSHVWVYNITEPRMFKLWLAMTDEQKRKTGIMAKLTPGQSVVLPPGIELVALNPTLPKLSGQDTDIQAMISTGLNEPEDISTGASRGTYASIKASRGPASDRTSDQIASFERWLRFDFWKTIFFIKGSLTDFPKKFEVNEATGFEDKKPIFKAVKKKPEKLIEIDFPISEMIDFESRAKGLLGVKHGPIAESLGISNKEVARRMGFNGYERLRLDKATEDSQYPELVYGVDAESRQEKAEGEPAKKTGLAEEDDNENNNNLNEE